MMKHPQDLTVWHSYLQQTTIQSSSGSPVRLIDGGVSTLEIGYALFSGWCSRWKDGHHGDGRGAKQLLVCQRIDLHPQLLLFLSASPLHSTPLLSLQHSVNYILVSYQSIGPAAVARMRTGSGRDYWLQATGFELTD